MGLCAQLMFRRTRRWITTATTAIPNPLHHRTGGPDTLAATGSFSIEWSTIMLGWALAFFLVAIVAAIFGFGGIAAGAASIAQILFFLFIILFIVSLIMGLARRGKPVP